MRADCRTLWDGSVHRCSFRSVTRIRMLCSWASSQAEAAQCNESVTQCSLFFKWIKQNLRIKHFYGTSENAVKTQIWIAVCVYVLAAIIKIDLALDVSLYTFLQVLSVHSFEKTPLAQALFDCTSIHPPQHQTTN